MIAFGIIAAMEAECEAFKRQMNNKTTTKIGGLDFITGDLLGQHIVLVQSDVGKVNAAFATTLMIKEFSPAYVINTGSAGGFAPDLNVGDVIISAYVGYHDVDVTAFGYEMGQVPRQNPLFEASKPLQNIALKAEVKGHKIRLGSILSGDSFVHDKNQLQKIQAFFPNADAIEMEAAAIAQICTLMDVPYIIIRSISDLVNKDDNNMDFKEFLPIAAQNSLDVVAYILKNMPEM